jgi:hypothetical protein
VDAQIHVILTSALVGGEWSASIAGERVPSSHWIGGRVGPRAGLNAMEKNLVAVQSVDCRYTD